MSSKYDWYWAERLALIRAALARAANGQPTVVGLPNLTSLGERQSWYGMAEVRGRDVVGSSMAHATSLAKTIAASGVCGLWPETTFRLSIAAAGDVLTISAAGGPGVQRASPAPGLEPARATSALASDFAAGGSAAGRADDAADDGDVAEHAAVERFYLALNELAEIVHGPRRLRDSHGTDGWPR